MPPISRMAKKIPTYEIQIDDVMSSNPAVKFVALVDNPAIEKGWMMFAKDGELKVGDYVKIISGKEHDPNHTDKSFEIGLIEGTSIALLMPDRTLHKWYVASELEKVSKNSNFNFKADPSQKERRIITGALMLTDTEIYRNTPEKGEFNVIFRKEQTETILKKFAKGNFYNNVNLMHTSELQPTGVYLIELFMVDKQRGIKTPTLFDEAPDGSIFASYYIENDHLWNEYIMKGRFTGFSVECFMDVLFSSDKFAGQPKETDEDELETAFKNMAKIFSGNSRK